MGSGLLLVLDVASPRTFHYVEGRAPIGPSEDSSSPLWSLCTVHDGRILLWG